MKKLIVALAASALLMSAANAQQVPAPQIAARSWTLLDATSGQIIASQDADMRIEPASLTKVMTAYVVFGAIRQTIEGESPVIKKLVLYLIMRAY